MITMASVPYHRPKVGVAVFITSPRHPKCVLIGKRKNSMGAGLFAPPGGHLEFGEEFDECGRRETMEETGLKLTWVRHEHTVNAIWREEDYHYIDIILKAEVDVDYMAEPENTEPNKCEGWEWYEWDKFPADDQLFWPLQRIRETGYHPFPSA